MTCTHGLLDRRAVVEAVDDVEVEIVGAEAAERAFDLAQDRLAGKAAFIEVDLACKHDILALDTEVLEGLSDELLARAMGIDIGGIEEVDALAERLLDDGLGSWLVYDPLVEIGEDLAKAHAADADAADLDVGLAKLRVFHGRISILSATPATVS